MPLEENKAIAVPQTDQAQDVPLIKSKERVQKHGEVFTPDWMVKKMLSYPEIQEKLQDMHATFLEPSAGEGAFLTEILRQKLTYVNRNPASRGGHWQYNTLWALMSIYGIEFLEDNLKIARANMLQVFGENYREKTGRELAEDSDLYRSARTIIQWNIVQGNTLTHKKNDGSWIMLNQWIQGGPKHRRSVIRRPFSFDSLFPSEEDTMGDLFGEQEISDEPKEFRIRTILRMWEEEE